MLDARQAHRIVIRFLIRDTGIGISKEIKDKLFQPFTQADSSMARRYGGTGLGLSISAHLVEMMGGEIGVDSQEGHGAVFWFTAPFERSAATVPVIQRARKNRLDELRVLVVDSNPTELDILHRYLDAWDVPNEKAADSIQAIHILEEAAKVDKPMDVAILDQRIFDTDSFSLAQKILSRPALARTRLIQLIPLDDANQRELAFQAGFYSTLSKPVKQSSLFDVLTNLANPDIETTSGEALERIKKTDKLHRRHNNLDALILVVEDNPANQKMVLYQLEKLGYSGHAVANGLEAIRALATIPLHSKSYDLVLMDCQMPEMDGFETTRRIRKNEAENDTHIPIIALTANAMQGDREACLESGMDDYISKPVTLDNLQLVLERYLMKKPTEDETKDQIERTADTQLPEDYSDVLDLTALDSIRTLQTETDTDLLKELIELYFSEGRKLLENLDQAIQAGDAHQIEFSAHRLKGSSAYLGVLKVGVICRTIEESARENELEQVRRLAPQLRSEYMRASIALRILQNQE